MFNMMELGQEIALTVVQNNGLYAHPENIIAVMLEDKRDQIQVRVHQQSNEN